MQAPYCYKVARRGWGGGWGDIPPRLLYMLGENGWEGLVFAHRTYFGRQARMNLTGKNHMTQKMILHRTKAHTAINRPPASWNPNSRPGVSNYSKEKQTGHKRYIVHYKTGLQ